MKKFIEGTVKTSYSIEKYICIYDTEKHFSEENAVENFLSETCFCDAFEVIEVKDASEKAIEKFNDAIVAIQSKTKVDDYFKRQALLYSQGYYETLEEMITENEEMF